MNGSESQDFILAPDHGEQVLDIKFNMNRISCTQDEIFKGILLNFKSIFKFTGPQIKSTIDLLQEKVFFPITNIYASHHASLDLENWL